MSASALRRRIAVGTGIVITSVTLAACSSSSSGSGPASGIHTSPVGTPSSASASASDSATSGGSTCASKAVAAARAALTTRSDVSGVHADGGCHQLAIATTLPSSDPLTPNSTKAMDICRAAAKVGYVDGISSITVSWTDGHEAAAGQQGMDCIPG